MTEETIYIKPWMRGFLLLAAIYNIVWGALIYYFPAAYYYWLSKGATPDSETIVKVQGALVVLIGIVLLAPAFGRANRWFLVGVGLIAKLLGGVLVYLIILQQLVTRPFVFQLIMSDAIWIIPFYIIMRHYKKVNELDTTPS